MDADLSPVPDDIEALKAALIAARAETAAVGAELASARAATANDRSLIAYLKLEVEKLRRVIYGPRAERTARLLDQLELQLEEAEADATEDELAAEQAQRRSTLVSSFERKRPRRKPFPDHLPRERVVIPVPKTCPCCGSARLSKLGEDITETLEVVPRQWKVIQTVRERFSCRECETITQPPAPFHVTPRGFAGPNLLAMILFEKFGQHQPLNRQSERYAREGVDLSLSTLADQVGACALALRPLHALIEQHVLSAERLHGDDTTVPILAKGKTETGRIWTYVRDDRRSAGGTRPQRSITPRAIGRANIPSDISSPLSASCRPTPIAAMVGFISLIAGHARSLRRCAGAIAGASFSSSLTSPRMRGAAGTLRRSRRSPWGR